jgi:hypothetical protein
MLVSAVAQALTHDICGLHRKKQTSCGLDACAQYCTMQQHSAVVTMTIGNATILLLQQLLQVEMQLPPVVQLQSMLSVTLFAVLQLTLCVACVCCLLLLNNTNTYNRWPLLVTVASV